MSILRKKQNFTVCEYQGNLTKEHQRGSMQLQKRAEQISLLLPYSVNYC
jgi:hypothetical protein